MPQAVPTVTCVTMRIDGAVIIVSVGEGDGGIAARAAMVGALRGCRRQVVAAIATILPQFCLRRWTVATAVTGEPEDLAAAVEDSLVPPPPPPSSDAAASSAAASGSMPAGGNPFQPVAAERLAPVPYRPPIFSALPRAAARGPNGPDPLAPLPPVSRSNPPSLVSDNLTT